MPEENDQVALEDSSNEDDATLEASAAAEAASVPHEAAVSEDAPDSSPQEKDLPESESADSEDSQEETSESKAEGEAPALSMMPTGMRSFGGAMLAASIIILLATIVIAMFARGKGSDDALINEFRTSMVAMSHKLAQIEAKTDPAPVIIGEVGNFDDFTRMMKVGNTQFTNGHFEEAAQSYAAAITLDASGKLADEAHYRLGMCLVKTGKPDEAIQEFRYVVQNHPGSRHYAASALEMGELLMDRKNFAQARRLFYLVLGSEAQLAEDQKDVLEKTYYTLARAYEGEAAAVESTRYNPLVELDFGVQTGETQ